MKRKLLFAAIFALLIYFAPSLPLFTAGKVTIVGTVQPIAVDANNNITAVSIETQDGPYAVRRKGIGKKLLRVVGKDVDVTGIIGENIMGNQTITVRKYEVIE